ncbi:MULTISPECIES: murein biosynthesis integral membrane protein MurJ [unclassified Candidatus Nanosynbacter]|uniref:murein biosynthesis integral membrane protein MurJ n=1 Tax=unclassified Candidatus Nanosynbacter TaxID=2725944 RepID=UPI001FB8400A|nr:MULTISPECIES: murein biosynthesis integral membrane protein MurJ [unclassified Candidatus Nanosynbacter]MCJ1963553.1 murein biosynthesis integral membrane protein MurJ [Candidatus Nanosynbacter sp. TM7-033]UOG68038.1 murein biosynthesis integral membrane protein MurJ [Candidatus Nanosynbacter sp. HMT-352]
MGRVRSTVTKINQRLNVKLAATILAGSTLLSSLLGFFRDRLLNSAYMPSENGALAGYPVGLDAYTAAFMVPDFMFAVLVSGALSVTFIPVFNERWVKGNKQSAWQISSSMINFMALITMAASVLIIIFADPLMKYLIAPGLSESGHALAVSMMQVIAVNPFIFAVAAVIASIQQAVGRFMFCALAPMLYNVGIIIGTVWFTGGVNLFGWQIFDGGIMGVALGVVLGSFLQLIVSAVGLAGLGFDYNFKIYWRNKGFRKVLSLLPARSVDQGMDYVVSLVEVNLASRLADGTVRAYQQALTLHMMPINLIGVAISNAAFPQLTEHLGEGRNDLFQKDLRSLLRIIFWMALPVSVVIFFTRGYVVHFIRNGGNQLIAGILGCLVVAILFRTIYHMAARAFYARQDTKTPLYISIFSITLNIILAIVLSMVLKMGAYGLAWAQSTVAVLEVVVLLAVMNRQMPKLFDMTFVRAIFKMMIAGTITGVVCYIAVLIMPFRYHDDSFFSAFPKFVIISLVSFGAYAAASKWLKLPEIDPILARLKKVLFGRLEFKG